MTHDRRLEAPPAGELRLSPAPAPAPRRRAAGEDAQVCMAAILDSTDDAVIGIALDGRILRWNDGAARIYGYSAEEAVGRSVALIVPDERIGELAAILGLIRQGDAVSHFETVRRRKDGRKIHVSLTSVPVTDPAGAIAGASSIARDITDRKNAEEAARMREAHLNFSQEIAHLGSFERDFLDPANDLWSAEMYRIFGLPPRPGAPPVAEFLAVVHAEDRRAVLRSVEDTRRRGAPHHHEFRLVRRDGSVRLLRCVARLVRAEDGSAHKMVGTVQDVTERRAIEQKLAQHESLAAIGGMVAVVSHELRNPLGAVILAARALARGGLAPAEREQVLSILAHEGARLDRTLTDLLEFARPREPRLAPGDLNATTREVLAALRTDEALTGRVAVEEALDEPLPPMLFDADQIRQVLWNLLRNAFQALNGSGRLEVRTEARGGHALVHIRDSGPGIPPDQIHRLFSPFHTTKTQGTGLGLPISRRIVVAHGGDIQVDSAPGRGSRFSVVLPLPE